MQQMAELFDEEFVRHDLTGAVTGIEGSVGVVNMLQLMLAAFPDLHLSIEDIVEGSVTLTLHAKGAFLCDEQTSDLLLLIIALHS